MPDKTTNLNHFTQYRIFRILILSLHLLLIYTNIVRAQDTTVFYQEKAVTLKEVVVRNNINVPAFMKRVHDDTSFYKAFRNLKILGYTSVNDVRMLNKKGGTKASLKSTTRQTVRNGCRWMDILESVHTGDYYTSSNAQNYYTAQMYSALFFTTDTVCGSNNIVGDRNFETKGKTGIAKHKEQLKMLFFNPGKKIPGIPFIGNKIAIFEEEVAALYDFVIDLQPFNNQLCYMFSITPRADLSDAEKKRIVINEMVTWFEQDSWEIVARNYDLSYNAGVYDFDVHVEVEMTRYKDYLVPKVLRYNGNWDLAFKPREKGVFTAVLSEFTD